MLKLLLRRPPRLQPRRADWLGWGLAVRFLIARGLADWLAGSLTNGAFYGIWVLLICPLQLR
jgi:hypothetical protein